MKTNSDIYPTIQRLQNSILYPHNITHNEATEDKRESWDYDCIRIPDENPLAPLSDTQTRTVQKAIRDISVNSVVVTVSTGKAFDGDELSQSRMSRVVSAMQIAGVTDAFWTLANNEIAAVTIAELQEAMVLSITRMSELWPLEQYEV